jgi:hypothetical protein
MELSRGGCSPPCLRLFRRGLALYSTLDTLPATIKSPNRLVGLANHLPRLPVDAPGRLVQASALQHRKLRGLYTTRGNRSRMGAWPNGYFRGCTWIKPRLFGVSHAGLILYGVWRNGFTKYGNGCPRGFVSLLGPYSLSSGAAS